MGCSGCSSGRGHHEVPAGASSCCSGSGGCSTGGCNKLNVFDWLSNMVSPDGQPEFDIVEVRFKNSRKDFFKNVNNLSLHIGEVVAVESSPGHDIGVVSATGELVRLQMKKKGIEAGESIKKIYRKAKVQDIEKWREAQDLETPTMYKARTFAIQHGLQMKISDVEYQGDKSKAIFYYTAEGRVDFRELIKTLAEQFRVRIEMRQIGSRQEAARLGGIGSCGRELCCSTWLSDFRTVSTSAARYQQLSLNPLKLAGQCGKLKCCLNYELDSYLDAIKDIPEIENRRLKTKSGSAVLQKTDIFRKIMWFSYEDKLDVFIPLDVARVKEVLEMNRNGAFPEELSIHKKEVGKPIVKEPDFENVVGQDSITRFDKNKGGKSQGHRNKFKGGNPQNPSKNPSNPQNSNDRNKQSAGKNFRRNSNNGNPNRGNPNRGNSNKPNNS